jgi:hypothetical protein
MSPYNSIQRNRCRNERKKKARRDAQYAKEKPCTDCGVQYPHYVMDFDHRPGERKNRRLMRKGRNLTRSVSDLARTSWKMFALEVVKCDVVCANCHRERTHQRKQHIYVPHFTEPSPQLELGI